MFAHALADEGRHGDFRQGVGVGNEIQLAVAQHHVLHVRAAACAQPFGAELRFIEVVAPFG